MSHTANGASGMISIFRKPALASGREFAISAASVLLVDKARDDSASVLHTIEVENQTNTLLLEIRRADSSACVYGCVGVCSTASTKPASTVCPA